jgi:hypothetical protein
MEVSKEPELLDGWFTSEDLYSLERRAIFSKVRLYPFPYNQALC